MFLLYHRRSRPTGRLLAEALGADHGREIPRATPDLLIRWGSGRTPTASQFIPTVNMPIALGNASDKLRAFLLMNEAGVPVPPFTDIRAEANAWLINGDAVFGRTRRGFRGQGITVYDDPAAWMDNHQFFTKFIPNEREYRLHVVGDQVVRVQRKYLDFPEERTDEHIKNHGNGYRFRQPRNRLKPSREEAAIKAVKALGLEFGAVDMIVDHEDREWVLEVNTAPACSPLTLLAYVDALTAMINGREAVAA